MVVVPWIFTLKQLFAFSNDRQQQTVQELKTNLKATVRSCKNLDQHQTAQEDQPEDLPDGANQPQDLQSDSAPEFSDTDPGSDSGDDGSPPELFDNESLLSEAADFENGVTVAAAFLDRWYPGTVTIVFDEENTKVSFLHPVHCDPLCNVFHWPYEADNQDVNIIVVLCKGLQLTPKEASAWNFVSQSLTHRGSLKNLKISYKI